MRSVVPVDRDAGSSSEQQSAHERERVGPQRLPPPLPRPTSHRMMTPTTTAPPTP
jgi:hypothetical protein